MKSRTICLLLALILAAVPVFASGESRTVLDLSQGPVVIGQEQLSGYTPSGRRVTTPNPNGYILTGSATGPDNTVQILDGEHAITLRGLSIQVGRAPEFMEDDHVAPEAAAIGITGGAHVALTIEGENTLISGDNHGGIDLSQGASLTVTAESTGSLSTTGGIDGAGIGSGSKQVCGDITIHGGTITAFGSDDSAGIGSGWSGTCGDITITGGTVTAGSHEGSGIGGGGSYGSDGFPTHCGRITISGGTVTATAGGMAAGIGAGMYEVCGDITISGGIVNATGAPDGAGIGGGWTSQVGAITISGGEVTAAGKGWAPGIGCGATGLRSGLEASCGEITLSGGTVNAVGGEYCPGVGSAWGGICEGLTITGGRLTSQGGPQSPGDLAHAREGVCGDVTISGGFFARGDAVEHTVYGLPVANGLLVNLLEDDQLWPYQVDDHFHDFALTHSDTDHWTGCTLCGLEYGRAENAVRWAVSDQDHWRECSACGGELPHSREPHLYESVVTEPTHSTDGFTTHTCTSCGHSYVDSVVTAPCPSRVYNDVPEGVWYHEAVDYATERGIMNGVGDGSFAPAMTTNRAMMTVLLYRLAGSPDVSGLTEPFEDVAPGQWFYDGVVWAYQTGIVLGQTPTQFAPGGELLRAHTVAMLHRYSGSPEADTAVLEAFTDGDSLGFATVPFAWAVSQGLVSGMGDGALAPLGASNRAQIAMILMGYLET